MQTIMNFNAQQARKRAAAGGVPAAPPPLLPAGFAKGGGPNAPPPQPPQPPPPPPPPRAATHQIPCDDDDVGGDGGGGASDRKRKRRSRWGGGDAEDKTFIPGMPTMMPSGLSKEQEEAYLCKCFFSPPSSSLHLRFRESTYISRGSFFLLLIIPSFIMVAVKNANVVLSVSAVFLEDPLQLHHAVCLLHPHMPRLTVGPSVPFNPLFSSATED